jgi:hypothetical protein
MAIGEWAKRNQPRPKKEAEIFASLGRTKKN